MSESLTKPGAGMWHHPKAYDLFIAVIAVLALTLAIWQLFLPPQGELAKLLVIFDYFFCLLFFIDYIHQIVVAPRKWRYIFTWGILDLASSIPPVWGLRSLKIVRVLRILRAIRSLRILAQVLIRDKLASALSMLMLLGSLIIIGSCIGVLHFESEVPGANITTAEDVAWWAVVTTSTVGYGDLYPVTAQGRLLAVLIMCVGIGLFATFAAGLAGIFMRRPRSPSIPVTPSERFVALSQENKKLADRLDAIEKALQDLKK